jgi:hypothetical protein
MNDPFTILIPAVIEALPDSISQRRQLLTAAVEILPDRHPMRAGVRDLLFALNKHEGAQREFLFGMQKGNR